jgi:hypothetical protein
VESPEVAGITKILVKFAYIDETEIKDRVVMGVIADFFHEHETFIAHLQYSTMFRRVRARVSGVSAVFTASIWPYIVHQYVFWYAIFIPKYIFSLYKI